MSLRQRTLTLVSRANCLGTFGLLVLGCSQVTMNEEEGANLEKADQDLVIMKDWIWHSSDGSLVRNSDVCFIQGTPSDVKAGVLDKCMDVSGGNSANGTPVQVYDCNGTAAQKWSYVPNGTLQALGKCLERVGGSAAVGTRVQLTDCTGASGQYWGYDPNSMEINQSGNCLGVGTDGARLEMQKCTLGPVDQARWTLPSSSGPVVETYSSPRRCLDVRGGSTENGTPVQRYYCNGTSPQVWTRGADNTLQSLGKCLDVVDGATENGSKVQLFDCNGTGAQVWQPLSNGALMNPQSHKCLYDPDLNGGEQVQLEIRDCLVDSQQWTSADLSAGGTIALASSPGTCMDVEGGSTANGAPIQIYFCNGTAPQSFTFGSDGTLRALGKCIDVNNGDTANGSKIQLFDCNGTGAQKWERRSDGTWLNPQSGRCIDVPLGSTVDGTDLQLWDCIGQGKATDTQRFTYPNEYLSPALERQLRDSIVNTWGAVTPIQLNYWSDCVSGLYNPTRVVGKRGIEVSGVEDGMRTIAIDNEAANDPLADQSWNRGQFIHEFGHTMGFNHEQARRDNSSGFFCQRVEGASSADIQTDFGVWDPTSVDNYCTTATKTHISLNDIKGAQSIYGVREFRRQLWSNAKGKETSVAAGSQLARGQSWISTDGKVTLTLSSDGDLQIRRPGLYVKNYDLANTTTTLAVWHSGTGGVGYTAKFASDGKSLGVYNASGTAVWSVPAAGGTGAKLLVKVNGDVAVVTTAGVETSVLNSAHRDALEGATGLITNESLSLGASRFTQSGRFELALGTDGVLSIYDWGSAHTARTRIWNTSKYTGVTSARMMPDGSLALLNSSGTKLWTASYTPVPGTFLALCENGNLAAYEPSKFEVWSAGLNQGGNGQGGTFQPGYGTRPIMLWNGASLTAGQSLTSASGRAKLTMQTTGDLVFTVDGQTRWSASQTVTGFDYSGTRATLTTGGDLQVINSSGKITYSSGTSFYMNAFLSFDDTGRLSINRIVTAGAESLNFLY